MLVNTLHTNTLGLEEMDKMIFSDVAEDILVNKEVEEILLAKKDKSKFAPLYERYYEGIFRYINKRISDRDMCFDLTSQVFLKAMLNIDKYEHRGFPFSSWLYRIANNEVVDFFRANANKVGRAIDISTRDIEKIAAETEMKITEEMYDKLFEEIQDLSDEELSLVEMRFFEDRPFKEIAEILNITENNAKVKLYRTLDKLKAKLN